MIEGKGFHEYIDILDEVVPGDGGYDLVRVSVDIDEEDEDQLSPWIFMCIYSFGKGEYRTDWKQRLRWIWRIIKRGNPWEDEVVLAPCHARKLADTLNRAAQKGDEAWEEIQRKNKGNTTNVA